MQYDDLLVGTSQHKTYQLSRICPNIVSFQLFQVLFQLVATVTPHPHPLFPRWHSPFFFFPIMQWYTLTSLQHPCKLRSNVWGKTPANSAFDASGMQTPVA